MKIYQNGDSVKAVVEDVYPFGIFVRLADDTRAYIRCRELTLAGDIDPRTIVARGSEITAIVSKQAETDRIMELSVRNSLPDPWDAFLQKTQVGAVVVGTVKNLYPDGVYVEIIPGVSGFIKSADLASWHVEHPEDLLWTGDHVEAVILKINRNKEKMQLSIRQRITQLSNAQNILEQLRIRQGGDDDITRPLEPIHPSDKDADLGQRNINLAVLVVEDTRDVREPLLDWLGNQGCRVVGTDMVERAMQIYQQDRFDIALVDLDLPVTNGLTFIQQLREANTSMSIAVMSDPQLIARSMDQLQELGVAAIFPKPLDLDEILQFLERLSQGEDVHLPTVTPTPKELDALEPYQELSTIMRSNRSMTERFQHGLEKLLQETKAEQAIVFHLDSISGIISLAAQAGVIPVDEEQSYGLRNSPVNDVIKRELPVWENHMDAERQRRFEKLLSLLSFESCIGAPIARILILTFKIECRMTFYLLVFIS